MLEILVTAFVTTFVAVTLFGHVMVARALMTPDHNWTPTSSHLQ